MRSTFNSCAFQLLQPTLLSSPAPVQPLLVPNVLLALPPSVRILELNSNCAGPVLEALKRFGDGLLELRITGNGAELDWGCRGAGGLLSKLVQLRLDFRQPPEWVGHGVDDGSVGTLPRSVAGRLAAGAAGLLSLALSVEWDANVPALCTALPALVELRWAGMALR